jgi:uncharacterized protein
MTTVCSEARVTTARAARYLGPALQAFRAPHPGDLQRRAGTDRVPGRHLRAGGGGRPLALRAAAADAPSLSQVEEVVARHLERSAFRDKPEISWYRSAP